MSVTSIVWKRVDDSGHEAARLTESDASNELAGAAVFVEGTSPVRLDYQIVCDRAWHTQ